MSANIKQKAIRTSAVNAKENPEERKFPEFRSAGEIFRFVEEEAQRRLEAEKRREAVLSRAKNKNVIGSLASCDKAVFNLIKKKFSDYPAFRIPRFIVLESLCSHHMTRKEVCLFLARLDSKGLIRNTKYGIEILEK